MNKNFAFLIIFSIYAIILAYYYNQTINKIGINEYGLLGFTTESYYQDCTENLAKYNVYSRGEYPNLEPSTYRPPFFALILSIVYKAFSINQHYCLILNNLLLLLTLLVIYKTGNLFNPNLGLLSSLLFIFEPFLLERANSIQTEILQVFLFSCSIYYATRIFYKFEFKNFNIIMFSLLFFLSTFTRTVTLYYPIIFLLVIPLLFNINKKIIPSIKIPYRRVAIIFFIINICGTLSWSFRNYLHTDNFDYIGMKGVHLGLFVAPGAYSKANEIPYTEARKIIRNKYFNNDYYNSLSKGEKQKYMTEIGKKIILNNPIGFLKHYIGQVDELFFGYPTTAILLFYSKDKMQIAEKMISDNSHTGVKGKIIVLKNLIDNGLFLYVLHIVLLKLFYILLFVGSLLGAVLIVTDKSYKYIFIGIVISSIYLYLIGIYLFSGPARLRISLLPMMVLFLSYLYYYIEPHIIKMINRSK